MMSNRTNLLAGLLVSLLASSSSFAEEYADLATMRWNHGAKTCKSASEPLLQVAQTGAKSFVLRQSKCSTFEAPFLFLLVGNERAVLVDTGAHSDAADSPVFATVTGLLQEVGDAQATPALLVMHSHSHSDHRKGDEQFIGKPGVSVVGTEQPALQSALGIDDWPHQVVTLDLGGRPLSIIPIPGHQAQSIAIYDHNTGWLLTGDSLYPGNIRVRDWEDYRASIARLTKFASDNPVSQILGTHIEWNSAENEIYPIGSTWQPHEPALGMSPATLSELNDRLQQTPEEQKLTFDNFVIAPLSRFEKFLSNMLSGS